MNTFERIQAVRAAALVPAIGWSVWLGLRHPELRSVMLRGFATGVLRALADLGRLLLAIASLTPFAVLLILRTDLNPAGIGFAGLGLAYLALGLLRPRWYLDYVQMQEVVELLGERGAVAFYFIFAVGLTALGVAIAVLERGWN